MTTEKKKRAKRGAGNFTTKPNGRKLYTFSLGIDPDTGKRVRKSVTGRTEKECRDKAADLISDFKKRLPGTSTEPLSTYLERWVTGRARFLKAMTIAAYRDSIKNSILPTLGPVTLDALTHRDVERMMAAVLKRGASGRTANMARTVLGTALRDAERDGLVRHNAAQLARSVTARPRVVEPLSPAEVEKLLRATRESRWWPAYVVAVSLGLRQGELLGLRWEDVAHGAVRVEHTLQKDTHVLEAPKTQQSRRTLPMPKPVRQALAVQRRIQRRERKQPGWVEWPDDLVFRTEYGRPVNGKRLTERFQSDLAAAGIPERRMHDLRHTCATFLLSRGVDIKVVSEILGHSTIAVTANTYAKVSEATKADALAHFKI